MPFPIEGWSETLSDYQKAELRGRRIVTAKETKDTVRLNTALLKSLTGDETVNARHPYGRPFEFTPVGKIFLSCNHKPVTRDDTHGFWRRIHVVPFDRTFTVDPTLPACLASEAPGILAWAIRGCLAWQKLGRLDAPLCITSTTQGYREESDSFGDFLQSCCVEAAGATTQARPLFHAYCAWCEREGLPPTERLNQRDFGRRLRERFTVRQGRQVTYLGIGLLDTDQRPQPELSANTHPSHPELESLL
jgi:putative DNA primase/helicase